VQVAVAVGRPYEKRILALRNLGERTGRPESPDRLKTMPQQSETPNALLLRQFQVLTESLTELLTDNTGFLIDNISRRERHPNVLGEVF
jgi:hypothetical protein